MSVYFVVKNFNFLLCVFYFIVTVVLCIAVPTSTLRCHYIAVLHKVDLSLKGVLFAIPTEINTSFYRKNYFLKLLIYRVIRKAYAKPIKGPFIHQYEKIWSFWLSIPFPDNTTYIYSYNDFCNFTLC